MNGRAVSWPRHAARSPIPDPRLDWEVPEDRAPVRDPVPVPEGADAGGQSSRCRCRCVHGVRDPRSWGQGEGGIKARAGVSGLCKIRDRGQTRVGCVYG